MSVNFDYVTQLLAAAASKGDVQRSILVDITGEVGREIALFELEKISQSCSSRVETRKEELDRLRALDSYCAYLLNNLSKCKQCCAVLKETARNSADGSAEKSIDSLIRGIEYIEKSAVAHKDTTCKNILSLSEVEHTGDNEAVRGDVWFEVTDASELRLTNSLQLPGGETEVRFEMCDVQSVIIYDQYVVFVLDNGRKHVFPMFVYVNVQNWYKDLGKCISWKTFLYNKH